MAAPLPGYIYFDAELYEGHYFIVGPEDPVDPEHVLAFCCSSQPHNRPNHQGCHSNHELPSFHIEAEHIPILKKPTWVDLVQINYYKKSAFKDKWRDQKDKLDLKLTEALLRCASKSASLAAYDAEACLSEANSILSVL